MRSNIKKAIPMVLLDLLISLYLVSAASYIFFVFSEIPVQLIYIAGIALILFLILHFSKASLGRKVYFETDNSFWKWEIVFLLLITFVTGWLLVEIQPVKFFTKFYRAGNILKGLLNPDFTGVIPLLKALAETVYLALMATVLAVPFAFVVSFLGARNLIPKTFLGNLIYTVVRTFATIIRSIEALVWAIIFSVWVGIGPFAGMLALMFHSIAALTKLYSEQIENIDEGPIEAIKSTGASTLQVWIYAVIPQIISPYIAFTIYRWDINVRMATIVGFVGGGGIGLALQQQQQLLRWRNVGLIMWMIAIVVWIMDMVSAKVREKLLKN